MSLNESIVEDATLTWFGELGYAIGYRPLIMAIPSLATLRDMLLPRLSFSKRRKSNIGGYS